MDAGFVMSTWYAGAANDPAPGRHDAMRAFQRHFKLAASGRHDDLLIARAHTLRCPGQAAASANFGTGLASVIAGAVRMKPASRSRSSTPPKCSVGPGSAAQQQNIAAMPHVSQQRKDAAAGSAGD